MPHSPIHFDIPMRPFRTALKTESAEITEGSKDFSILCGLVNAAYHRALLASWQVVKPGRYFSPASAPVRLWAN